MAGGKRSRLTAVRFLGHSNQYTTNRKTKEVYTMIYTYRTPTGDTGTCYLLRIEGGFAKVQDATCGAILWLRPEWLEG